MREESMIRHLYRHLYRHVRSRQLRTPGGQQTPCRQQRSGGYRARAGTTTAAALALAAGALVVAPAPAQAAACSGTTGVTVVVDFTRVGGDVVTACAPGDPATGLAALQGAGFAPTGTRRSGLAFICRINGLPTAAQDACVNTPPADAYWSYWHAARQGTWTYSTQGATVHNPAQNTVEGWSFGSGQAPGISPP
jgi:hypothetical protein